MCNISETIRNAIMSWYGFPSHSRRPNSALSNTTVQSYGLEISFEYSTSISSTSTSKDREFKMDQDICLCTFTKPKCSCLRLSQSIYNYRGKQNVSQKTTGTHRLSGQGIGLLLSLLWVEFPVLVGVRRFILFSQLKEHMRSIWPPQSASNMASVSAKL
jgi:hypothetical protein